MVYLLRNPHYPLFTKKSPLSALKNHPGKVTVYADEEAGSLVKEINKKF